MVQRMEPHYMDGRDSAAAPRSIFILRQDISDRFLIYRYAVITITAKDDSWRGTYHAGRRPAHPAHPVYPAYPAYPAHPGKVLMKVLALVFPSVRDTAKTLETSYSTECLSAHRLTVQRTEHIDGWTGAVLRRPDRSSSAHVVLRHGNCHHFDALT